MWSDRFLQIEIKNRELNEQIENEKKYSQELRYGNEQLQSEICKIMLTKNIILKENKQLVEKMTKHTIKFNMIAEAYKRVVEQNMNCNHALALKGVKILPEVKGN
jgi:type III secretion system FlhB-like substrate exporter